MHPKEQQLDIKCEDFEGEPEEERGTWSVWSADALLTGSATTDTRQDEWRGAHIHLG